MKDYRKERDKMLVEYEKLHFPKPKKLSTRARQIAEKKNEIIMIKGWIGALKSEYREPWKQLLKWKTKECL